MFRAPSEAEEPARNLSKLPLSIFCTVRSTKISLLRVVLRSLRIRQYRLLHQTIYKDFQCGLCHRIPENYLHII